MKHIIIKTNDSDTKRTTIKPKFHLAFLLCISDKKKNDLTFNNKRILQFFIKPCQYFMLFTTS